MIVTQLQSVFASMDIEEAAPGMLLGDDLGMDSQELLCATVDLADAFSVAIDDGELHREMRLLDVAALIASKLAPAGPKGRFDDGQMDATIIEASADAVYDALFNFRDWPERLPHVRAVNSHYDDGTFQEFDMEVEGANGDIIDVRSVRRCEPGRISFFQPKPPRFLRHHCGDWVIRSLDDNVTHVLARHQWQQSEDACAHFSASDKNAAGQDIRALLGEHARFALACWKANLEGRAAQ